VRYLLALVVCAAAWGQISVAPTTVDFGSYAHGQSIPPQTVMVTAGESWRATPGANWLAVTPQSGAASTTPATVTFLTVASNLAPRETPQTTTVVFTSTLSTGTPAPPVTVNVTISFKPVVSVSRTGFTYNSLPGQTPPVESFALVANDPNNAAWTITPAVTTPRNGTWLGVSTRAGSGSLDTVIVLITTAGLPVGNYSGTVTVTPGAPAAPIVLPVSLIISSGAPNVSLSSPYFTAPGSLTFAGGSPPTQNFTLINTGGSQFNWTAAVTTDAGGNWLLASPKSGTSATTVTVAVNGVGLAAGTYTGLIRVSVPGAVVPTLEVRVGYTISPTTPVIASSGVVHAATFINSAVSPGQLVTIFGSNLANGVAAAVPPGNTLPVLLGITSMTMGGFACPLFFVSPTQINAQAPYELVGPTAQVVVTLGGVASQPAVINVEAASPAIFSLDGTGLGTATILRNSDFSLITSANPARRGEVVAIFCTGLGQVEGGGISGLAATVPTSASAVVGVNFAAAVAPVRYAGLAIGFAGLYQINVVVPTMGLAATGPVPVTIRVGNIVSPPLNTYVEAQRR